MICSVIKSISQAPTGRIREIDVARGLAVILMVGCHAAGAFLADEWKGNDLWYDVNILFGFVAPAFAFLSGVTLWMALRRREEVPGGGSVAARYGIILLLGYWLQTPVLSLRQLIYKPAPDLLARMFDANILQVIALAGLALTGLWRITGSLRRTGWIALGLGFVVMIATPYVWSSGLYGGLPLPVRFYLAPQPPATFPLFPYAAYFLFGFVAAAPVIAAAGSVRGRVGTAIVGGGLIAAGFLLDALLRGFPPHGDFWGSSIGHQLFRMGGVMLLISIAFLIARADGADLDAVAFIGRRSLPLYILHLMLIYGSPMTMGMRYWLGGVLNRSLSPVETMLVAILVLGICALAVFAWEGIRRRRPDLARWGIFLWWGLFWGFFLLTP
ncbi:MAG: acyltransferase [Candidatus Kapaibacterium sp.]